MLAFGQRYSAGQAALARVLQKMLAARPVVRYGPNPHHAAGRSRTGGIPWTGRKAKAR
jgi:hypothetical protein